MSTTNSEKDVFKTDVRWQDLLELSKTLEASNHRLLEYYQILYKSFFIEDRAKKQQAEIMYIVNANKNTMSTIERLCADKREKSAVVLEDDAITYLKMSQTLDNTITLSNNIEESIKPMIDEYTNKGKNNE